MTNWRTAVYRFQIVKIRQCREDVLNFAVLSLHCCGQHQQGLSMKQFSYESLFVYGWPDPLIFSLIFPAQ